MAHCLKCGRKLPKNALFCPKCGTKVKKKPSAERARLKLEFELKKLSDMEKSGWHLMIGAIAIPVLVLMIMLTTGMLWDFVNIIVPICVFMSMMGVAMTFYANFKKIKIKKALSTLLESD